MARRGLADALDFDAQSLGEADVVGVCVGQDWAGMVVFLSLPATAVVAALTLDELPWVAGSVVAAAYLTVTSGRFGTAWEADHPRTGLIQRLMIIPGWLWLSAVCWHLAS